MKHYLILSLAATCLVTTGSAQNPVPAPAGPVAINPFDRPNSDVTGHIKTLEAYKKAWKKAKAEHGSSYTYRISVSSMIGNTYTDITVKDDKPVRRKVSHMNMRIPGGEEKVTLDESGADLNKGRHFHKATTVEDKIAEAEKLLADYQANKVKGRMFFRVDGLTLICLVTPHMVADHPGNGVRINSVTFTK